MEKMKQLYEKVAADSTLQEKFSKIMSEAETAGETATGEKLTAFAKEAGFDVTIEEVQDFFSKLSESEKGELSESELDMVAGGKSAMGFVNITFSVASLGVACAAGSITRTGADALSRLGGKGPVGTCLDYFK